MNIVQLNNLIEGISMKVKFVNSFSTDDVYKFWNTAEVKYGSIAFGIKNAETGSGLITYSCILYYGDRLLENRTNLESIYSDATTSLNQIIGTLENIDDITINGNYRITYFTQKFADELAGGYVELNIQVAQNDIACGWDGYIAAGKSNQNKTVEVIENGTIVVTYDPGFDGLARVEIVTNVPTVVNNQSKSIDITENGVYNVMYDPEYTGMRDVTINANVKSVESYNDLTDKPRINGVTLTGRLVSEDLGLQPKGNYLTKIPAEYITESELENKDYVNHDELEDKGYLTSVKTINGKDITGTGNIEIAGTGGGIADAPNDGYAYLRQSNNWARYTGQDLSDYVTKTELALKHYVSESVLESKGYLTAIPEEYVTETELDNKNYVTETELNGKGYLTAIPEEYVTEHELDTKGYLTSIPSEYVTETELSGKGYLTSIPEEYVTDSELEGKDYATKQFVTSQGYLTSIPSEYVTETELSEKGYLTSIPSEYVTETELSEKGYLTSIPSEYVTDSELEGKDYLTKTEASTTYATLSMIGDINTILDKINGEVI